jgi:hypothetical protein
VSLTTRNSLVSLKQFQQSKAAADKQKRSINEIVNDAISGAISNLPQSAKSLRLCERPTPACGHPSVGGDFENEDDGRGRTKDTSQHLRPCVLSPTSC